MFYHVFRRFICVTLFYVAVILGIFIIQFRNEIVINKNIGNLRATFHQENVPNQQPILKNNFQIVYKGITFFADQQHPVHLVSSSGELKETEIETYTMNDDYISLLFKNGSSLNIKPQEEDGSELLTAACENPVDTDQLLISCRASGGYTIDRTNSKGLTIFSSKDSMYAISDSLTSQDELSFIGDNSTVRYASYTPIKETTYEMLATSPLAQKDLYDTNIKQFRTSFVTAFKPENASNASEKEIAAYIAESALQGRFTGAVRTISNLPKLNSKETYLSAPYFNHLVDMNKTMVTQYKNILTKINQSISSNTLDAFEIDNLMYALAYENKVNISEKLFSTASHILSQEDFTPPTLIQAAGILNAYSDAAAITSKNASLLQPAVDRVLTYLVNAFIQDESYIAFKSEIVQATPSESCRIAQALIKYGKTAKNSDVLNTGYLLMNSTIARSNIKDVKQLADLYPAIVQNGYYPHMDILLETPQTPITIWTCSPEVTLTSPEVNKLVLNIKFTVGESHYMIIKGIKPFNAIEMYDLNYRSDKQFESYSSPGYVYDFETQTLFLKMRHKNEIEKVVFTYTPAAAQAAGANGQDKSL